MVKVTLLGAGSGFTQPLFTDILHIEGLDRGTLGMVDVDAKRLEVNIKLIEKLLKVAGKTSWKLEASTDRRDVLKGTDYLISTIEVNGMQCMRHDNDIPLKYGVEQCVGDTIGPGGIMKLLRTAPAFIDILQDAKRYCPDAQIMNYTNPMSMITLAGLRSTDQPLVGLCHSVQWDQKWLSDLLGIPKEEMEWRCGGLNHLAWFTVMKHKGKDLYPKLLQMVEDDPKLYERNAARFEMLKHFGYYVTESSSHFSEYVPYFRRTKKLLKTFANRKYNRQTGWYADVWPEWRVKTDRERKEMAEGKREIKLGRSHEYAADIIEAHALNRPRVFQGTVANTGLITNLLQTGVVEVPVLVDKAGYQPTYFGALPEHCAALCRAHQAVHEMAVLGLLNHDREAIIQSMMLDPLTAAVASLAEIRAMADELFEADAKYIPDWCRKPTRKARKAAGKKATK
ncbi:MAG: alpha-glucosidase/alpha-galactosidase [Verrucomicrobia bacterium]|nr:alpha-glucosidase/alpha-galactosidase [Verrucomicrobiota bacterium]